MCLADKPGEAATNTCITVIKDIASHPAGSSHISQLTVADEPFRGGARGINQVKSGTYEEERALTSLWSVKLHYEFVESTQDCDFMLTLNAEMKWVKDGIGTHSLFLLAFQ